MGTSPPEDSAVKSITKNESTDEKGIQHGVVNPHFIKNHDIRCVGQFIKQLLETTESNDWSGWIVIKNGDSEFGNPRVFYVGSQKEKDTNKILPGAITTVVDYNRAWVETNLIRAEFKSITYTDNFGKIDWIIELGDPVSYLPRVVYAQ